MWDVDESGAHVPLAGLKSDPKLIGYLDMTPLALTFEVDVDGSFRNVDRKCLRRAIPNWGPYWSRPGAACPTLATLLKLYHENPHPAAWVVVPVGWTAAAHEHELLGVQKQLLALQKESLALQKVGLKTVLNHFKDQLGKMDYLCDWQRESAEILRAQHEDRLSSIRQ